MKKLLSALLALAATLVLKVAAQDLGAVVAMQECYAVQGDTVLVPLIVNTSTATVKTIRGGVSFDPAKFTFLQLALGPSIAENSPAAILDVDVAQINSGRLGFQLRIPDSAPGLPPVKLNYFAILKLRDKHLEVEDSIVEFSDNPYPKEVKDAAGNRLTSFFVDGFVGILAPNETRKISLNENSIQAGSLDVLPISIEAKGNENSIGLSIAFDQSRFTFIGASPGTGAPGATVTINQGLNAGGLVGLSLVLPPEQVLQPGPRQIFQVRFRAKPFRAFAGGQYFFTFGGVPTDAVITTPTLETIRESFAVEQTLLVEGVEGDVAPRPNGNRVTSLSDWVQVGRFVVGLDIANDTFEFQKADCAPKNARGDGVISLSDWVQAGRYAAGLDQSTNLGGPAGPLQFIQRENSTAVAHSLLRPVGRLPDQTRRVLLSHLPTKSEDRSYVVSVQGRGDENGLAFTIEFDAEAMEFESAEATNGGAHLFVNTADAGRVGIAMALQPGQSMAAGLNEALVLRFKKTGAKAPELNFVDAPVRGEVVSTGAEVVPAVFAVEAARPIKRVSHRP